MQTITFSSAEGALPIHHCLSWNTIDMGVLESLLVSFPEGAIVRNIHGQTPLHLLLESCSPNLDALEMVLHFCPESAR